MTREQWGSKIREGFCVKTPVKKNEGSSSRVLQGHMWSLEQLLSSCLAGRDSDSHPPSQAAIKIEIN